MSTYALTQVFQKTKEIPLLRITRVFVSLLLTMSNTLPLSVLLLLGYSKRAIKIPVYAKAWPCLEIWHQAQKGGVNRRNLAPFKIFIFVGISTAHMWSCPMSRTSTCCGKDNIFPILMWWLFPSFGSALKCHLLLWPLHLFCLFAHYILTASY